MKINGLKTYGSANLIKEIKGKNPVFTCVIATTETSRIPGISGAGASPELTEYTPAADVEIMVHGNVHCMKDIPQTVVGDATAPTPAMLTRASLKLGNIPFLIVDAGSKIKPDVECLKFTNSYGKNIKTGKSVDNPLEIFENGKQLGEELSENYDYIVIGESIAGGTTTALGVLKALGYDANEKVSGSMPNNPHSLKINTVNEGLKNAKLDPTKEKIDPFTAIAAVGDPMLPGVAGIAINSKIPVILAGGTQMAGVCAIIKAVNPNFDFSNLNIATTVFVAEDSTADLLNLVNQIGDITVNVINPNFESSNHKGLKNYLSGFVKEGAGAGGAMFTALMKGSSIEDIRKKIENVCK